MQLVDPTYKGNPPRLLVGFGCGGAGTGACPYGTVEQP